MSDGGVLPPGEGKGFPLPGARIVFKVWGEHEPGNHDVAEFTAEPGFRGPQPHIHRVHEELFYVLEGSSTSWWEMRSSGSVLVAW
jgi:quercetin dioxygenase-like cupin family protein